jgi:hypothetical protein
MQMSSKSVPPARVQVTPSRERARRKAAWSVSIAPAW